MSIKLRLLILFICLVSFWMACNTIVPVEELPKEASGEYNSEKTAGDASLKTDKELISEEDRLIEAILENQFAYDYIPDIFVEFDCLEKTSLCPKSSKYLFELRYKAHKYKTFWGPSFILAGQNQIVFYDKTSVKSTSLYDSYHTTIYSISFEGKLLWRLVVPGKGIHLLTDSNGVVIVTTHSKGDDGIGTEPYPITSIYAIDMVKGKRIWFKDFRKRNLSIPSSDDKLLFLADKNLLAIDIKSGQIVWEKKIPTKAGRLSPRNPQPVVGNENIYVPSLTRDIVSFDKEGKVIWSTKLPEFSAYVYNMALDRNENLYVASGTSIFSLSSKGELRWKYSPFAVSDLKSIVLDDRNHVYSTSEREGLHILSLDTSGQLLWKYAAKVEHFFVPPVITTEGLLFSGKCKNISCLKLLTRKGQLNRNLYNYPQISQNLSIHNQLKRIYFWIHEGNILGSHRAVLVAAQINIFHSPSWYRLYGNSQFTSRLK